MSTEKADPLALVLQTAAYNGDSMTVRRLMQEAVDPNCRDRWGRTPLSLAAQKGNLEVVKILIAANAAVNPWEEYAVFDTPLIAAAESGFLDVVQALIAAGANLQHHGGPSQATAEHYARTNGHQEVSEYLLRLTFRSDIWHVFCFSRNQGDAKRTEGGFGATAVAAA